VRRLATLLVSLTLAGGFTLAASAAPAQAHYPNGDLRNVYSDGAFCRWYGGYGVENGLWDWYICEYHGEYPPGLYFLWSFDYD